MDRASKRKGLSAQKGSNMTSGWVKRQVGVRGVDQIRGVFLGENSPPTKLQPGSVRVLNSGRPKL